MSTDRPSPRDRYLGALVGLAVGDALGAPIQFRKPGTFVPVTGMAPTPSLYLPPGGWTDDTSMALCLAESLLESGGFDARDQMNRYVRWKNEGHLSCTGRCIDIGQSIFRSLSKFEKNGDPFAGSTDSRHSGNGSLMRLAPVPLFFSRVQEESIEKSGESSRTTHGSPECVDACRYFGFLIQHALSGKKKDELFASHFPGDLCPPIRTAVDGFHSRVGLPKGSGYVVESLEAALWAFDRGQDFRKGMLRAVNLGDDADTTGAIYGQLAGAFYGIEAIPSEWREALVKRDLIESYAARLYDSSQEVAG